MFKRSIAIFFYTYYHLIITRLLQRASIRKTHKNKMNKKQTHTHTKYGTAVVS